jgi:GTPase SAR1 family protein
VDFMCKNLESETTRLKLQLWEIAESRGFRIVYDKYFNLCSGVILVYSCDDRRSFAYIEEKYQSLKKLRGEGLCLILVANKCDLPKKEISAEEGKALADKLGLDFFETSAKDDREVTRSILRILELILAKARNSVLYPPSTPETKKRR